MTLGRKKEGDIAITLINSDQKISHAVLEKITKLEKVEEALVINL